MSSKPTASRFSGRTTVTLKPTTDSFRACSHNGHSSRKAVALRVSKLGLATYYKPECRECASKPVSKARGVLETVVTFA